MLLPATLYNLRLKWHPTVRVAEEVWTLHDRTTILRYSCLAFLASFSFYCYFNKVSRLNSYRLTDLLICYVKKYIGHLKKNIYVLSGDESTHSSLLRWVILIEKKKKKKKNRAYSFSKEIGRIPQLCQWFEN